MKRKSTIKSTIFDRLRITLVIGISAVFLILFSALISSLSSNWLILPLGISFLLVEIALFWIWATLSSKITHKNDQTLSFMSGVTLDFLMGLVSPVSILSEEGSVIW